MVEKRKMNGAAEKLVFIHALFRTGSTYFWNKFRTDGRFYCYYEAFHQILAQLDDDKIDEWDIHLQSTASVGHPTLSNSYLSEYRKLLNPSRPGVPYFKKSFSFDEFCHTGDNPDARKYIDFLVGQTEGLIPVVQFNRSAFRTQWFKRNYPHALNIYLVRNPRDQWHSYLSLLNRKGDDIFLVMDLITASLNREEKLFEPLAKSLPLAVFRSECFDDEVRVYRSLLKAYSMQEKYSIFYYLWLVGLLINLENTDMLIDMGRLSDDDSYRKEIHEAFAGFGLEGMDFEDAAIKKYGCSEDDEKTMDIIEKKIQSLVFSNLKAYFGHALKSELLGFSGNSLDIVLPPDSELFPESEVDSSDPIRFLERYAFFVELLGEANLRLQKKLLDSERLANDRGKTILVKDSQISKKDDQLSRKDQLLSQKDRQIMHLQSLLDSNSKELQEKMLWKDRLLAEKDRIIEKKDVIIEKKDVEFRSADKAAQDKIAWKDRLLAEKDRIIEKKDVEFRSADKAAQDKIEWKDRLLAEKDRIVEKKDVEFRSADKAAQDKIAWKDRLLAEKDRIIEKKDVEFRSADKAAQDKIAWKNRLLAEKENTLLQKRDALARIERQLNEKIAWKDRLLAEKDRTMLQKEEDWKQNSIMMENKIAWKDRLLEKNSCESTEQYRFMQEIYSQIAVQVNRKDNQISQLMRQLEQSRKERDALDAKIDNSNSSIFFRLKRILRQPVIRTENKSAETDERNGKDFEWPKD